MRSYDTPILLMIFNRPKTTKVVFDAISKIKPRYLFIAADGPRKNKFGEKEMCEKARQATKQINWDCNVKRLYQKDNLGCGLGPYTAISWFFGNVEEGIILEDDCLPNEDFFRFCEEMLIKYRTNTKIMHIGGNNFQQPKNQDPKSYYFSKYPHSWGWATWRRAWKFYNFEMRDWPDDKQKGILNSGFDSYLEKQYWLTVFDMTYNNKTRDVWDYQWLYTIWKKHGLAITPGVNLVENIGFGADSTHTKKDFVDTDFQEMRFPLKKPRYVSPNLEFDRYTSYVHFKIDPIHICYLKIISLTKKYD